MDGDRWTIAGQISKKNVLFPGHVFGNRELNVDSGLIMIKDSNTCLRNIEGVSGYA